MPANANTKRRSYGDNSSKENHCLLHLTADSNGNGLKSYLTKIHFPKPTGDLIRRELELIPRGVPIESIQQALSGIGQHRNR